LQTKVIPLAGLRKLRLKVVTLFLPSLNAAEVRLGPVSLCRGIEELLGTSIRDNRLTRSSVCRAKKLICNSAILSQPIACIGHACVSGQLLERQGSSQNGVTGTNALTVG
jgi:hypothetical protein